MLTAAGAIPRKPRERRFEQVARFCREYQASSGFVPSYTTIAVKLGICDRSTVRRYVVQAEGRGLLVRSGVTIGGRGNVVGQRIRLVTGSPSP